MLRGREEKDEERVVFVYKVLPLLLLFYSLSSMLVGSFSGLELHR